MTKVIFILFSISSSLKFWSVNHTSIYENYELKVFKNLIFFGENLIIDQMVYQKTNVYKTLESYW